MCLKLQVIIIDTFSEISVVILWQVSPSAQVQRMGDDQQVKSDIYFPALNWK